MDVKQASALQLVKHHKEQQEQMVGVSYRESIQIQTEQTAVTEAR
jgi:hypothetical protein